MSKNAEGSIHLESVRSVFHHATGFYTCSVHVAPPVMELLSYVFYSLIFRSITYMKYPSVEAFFISVPLSSPEGKNNIMILFLQPSHGSCIRHFLSDITNPLSPCTCKFLELYEINFSELFSRIFIKNSIFLNHSIKCKKLHQFGHHTDSRYSLHQEKPRLQVNSVHLKGDKAECNMQII